MSQLNYVSEMIDCGYKEISFKDCPVIWSRRDVLYFQKGNYYAMVNSHGFFVNWEHPKETEIVNKNYGEKNDRTKMEK